LNNLVDIGTSIPEGKGQVARAYFRLSRLYAERGKGAECTACVELAKQFRAEAKPELCEAPFEEETFSRLCLWMLW